MLITVNARLPGRCPVLQSRSGGGQSRRAASEGNHVKAAAFDYHVPATLDEAIGLLAEHGGDARVLAGGQSLVPSMTARLARPAHVIDINRIARAKRPSVAGARLRIPPLMRHIDFESLPIEGPLAKLLARLSESVAPLPVRMRGTFCGAIANGDPSAEWCLAVVVLKADILVRSRARGVRTIAAPAFFETVQTTVAEDDEMICEVQIPLLAPTVRTGFAKIARRAGDFGLALGLCLYDNDEGVMVDARVGIGGVEEVPRRLAAAEDVLEGQTPSRRLFRLAAEAAADTASPLEEDAEGAAYMRDLTHAAVRRALERTL